MKNNAWILKGIILMAFIAALGVMMKPVTIAPVATPTEALQIKAPEEISVAPVKTNGAKTVTVSIKPVLKT